MIPSLLLKLLFFLNLFLLSPAQKTLEDKVRSLVDLRNRDDVIKFNSAQFKEFCRSSPRNYSVIGNVVVLKESF